MRAICAVALLFLPSAVRRGLYRLLGWNVHPTAHIGRSLILARTVTLGPGASVGSFNVIRGLEELRLAEGASIATRNWISSPPHAAAAFGDGGKRRAALILGRHALITIGHEIDCSDTVELGDHARLAGFRSQILTHNLNLVRDRWMTSPVVLAERAVVMSGCVLLSGTRVPARAIVSAGSVVTTPLTKEQTLYRGNPAEPVRDLPDNLRFFQRQGPALDAG